MKKVARAADVGARQAWLWRHRDSFGCGPIGDRPRILVDVSAIIRHDAQTGIQRVVRAVWSDLSSRRQDAFQVVPVYATNTRGYCYASPDFLTDGTIELPATPVSVRPGDKFLGLDLSAHLLPKYRRQLRAWRAHGASIHLVVYDLLPMIRPEWFNGATTGHFRRWFEVVAEEADQAICISDEVVRDLSQQLSRFGCKRPPSMARLQMGADISASVPSTGTCGELKRLLDQIRFRPAVLMVGTIEPRKGYDAALAGFEHLWRTRPSEAPDLIIVGKGGWKTANLQARIDAHPERGRRLHWFDRMSDEGLCLLYGASKGVLMASRGEGFGLPLIEAAMHRRHVLARDLPVFREQKLPNVLFFSDDAPTALGERLLELVSLGQEHEAPAADLPTWSDCVDGLLKELGFRSQPELHQVEPPLRIAS